jgi:hypothetical protein
MSSIYETAYPRFKPEITPRELADIYTPSEAEQVFARRHGRSVAGRLARLVHVKTVQRLGYFAKLVEVPPRIIAHIATGIGVQSIVPAELRVFDLSSTRQRLLKQVRRFLGLHAITGKTEHLIEVAARAAAETKQELADIINVVLEELIRPRYELPGFSTLVRGARQGRNPVNNHYFRSLADALSPALKQEFDAILVAPSGEASTGWLPLKREPKKPTNPEVRAYFEPVQGLKTGAQRLPARGPIPVLKFHQSVLEARALDAADLKAMQPVKRSALMVLRVHAQLHRALDDAVAILRRKLRKLHAIGAEPLDRYPVEHRKRAEKPIATLRQVLLAFQEAGTDAERGAHIATALQGESDRGLAECDEHMAYASDHYFPFMMASYHNQRPLLLNGLGWLELASTTSDSTWVQAITFVLKHRHSPKERLPIAGEGIHRH